MKKICYYTIAKYIPDTLRNEPRNFGLIFLNEDNSFYDARFLNTSHQKIASVLKGTDRQILNHFTKYYKEEPVATKDQLVAVTSNGHESRIQFTEVMAVVAEDLKKEFDYLYNTFVIEKQAIPTVHKSTLKTNIKNELKELHLVGSRKILVNEKVTAPKSKLEHTVDFYYKKKNHIFLIEAVDLTINDKRDTYKTAYKFQDLANGRKKNVETISLVKKTTNVGIEEFLSALKATSTVYDYSNGGRAEFIGRMEKALK